MRRLSRDLDGGLPPHAVTAAVEAVAPQGVYVHASAANPPVDSVVIAQSRDGSWSGDGLQNRRIRDGEIVNRESRKPVGREIDGNRLAACDGERLSSGAIL